MVLLRGTADPPLAAKELDRLANLTEGHVIQLEKKASGRVAAETVCILASSFGVSMDWLYRGVGKAPAANDIQRAVRRLRSRTAE